MTTASTANTSSDSIAIEVCVATPEGVRAAAEAGADRVEVCTDLATGGMTPSDDLIATALQIAAERLRVRVLVRHSEGFTYTDDDIATTEAEVRRLRQMFPAIDGYVVGALDTEGQIPDGFLARMREAAGEATLVFHRAFDQVADREHALDQIRQAGFDAILTAGPGASKADTAQLAHDIDAASPLAIIVSGGIRLSNVVPILAATKAREVHFRAPVREDLPDSTDPALVAAMVSAIRA